MVTYGGDTTVRAEPFDAVEIDPSLLPEGPGGASGDRESPARAPADA